MYVLFYRIAPTILDGFILKFTKLQVLGDCVWYYRRAHPVHKLAQLIFMPSVVPLFRFIRHFTVTVHDLIDYLEESFVLETRVCQAGLTH